MDTTINSTHIPYSQMTPEQKAQRRHETQQVAAGVGAAGVTAHVATTRKSSMGMLRKMYADMMQATKTVPQTKEVATGLWGRLVRDTKRFSGHAMKHLLKFKDNKILGPIIKSPVMKKITGLFGGVTAFFVLITGLSETSKNGKIALADIKDRFNIAA